MELILADHDGRQIRELMDVDFDAELNGGDRTFEISMPSSEWSNDLTYGNRIFVPGTEIGGIIGMIITETETDSVSIIGDTWRGRMEQRIIVPPVGQDYYSVSGELNKILKDMIEPIFGWAYIVSNESTGVTIEDYSFDRFCTLRSGIEKMLKSVGYRLDISYRVGSPNECGYVFISAKPIVDHSDRIELSQDSQLNFRMEDKRNGVNHLIAGGKGELQERNVIDLYVQKDGSIGKNQFYKGIDCIEYFYENTSSETEEMEAKAIEKLKELMNIQAFDMDVEALGIDVKIGDIVGGRDYITGMSMKKPVENIVVTIRKGVISKDYKLEG